MPPWVNDLTTHCDSFSSLLSIAHVKHRSGAPGTKGSGSECMVFEDMSETVSMDCTFGASLGARYVTSYIKNFSHCCSLIIPNRLNRLSKEKSSLAR